MKNTKKTKLLPNRELICGRSVFSRPLLLGAFSVVCLSNSMPLLAETLNGDLSSVTSVLQEKVLRGTVLDENGEPLIGVTVLIKGTSSGTVTDFDGNFSLNVPSDAILEISYIGYKTQEISVGNQKNVVIKMVSDNEILDEVVVIGYQTVSRRDLTGSVASVKGEDIASIPVSNVAQAMQGKLPGVNITSQDGRPDAEISIRVRGGGSISQSNEPLILIDGIPGSLNDIPSDQVESIDVLKDASSTAIYGARGANGVILVTTKGAKEGKTVVTYNGYVKFNTPTKYLEALSPYDYLCFVWGNAAASGDAYREPFEKLYGIGSYTGNNTGGIESYRNIEHYDVQKDVYNTSVSHNHDMTVTGGTDKTKVLFSLNYMDEQGMKINSYAKRAGASLKVNQKINDRLDVSLDARYTDYRNMGDEGTVNGQGSLLSTAYRFRPIATNNILGDLNALHEGNMEHYGRTTTWDTYSPVSRIGDYEPLDISQKLRATLSLNWKIFEGLNYHTDFSYNNSWGQTKNWAGAIYNEYLDDLTGEKMFAGSVDYKKSDSWSLRWINTLSYDFTFLPKEHKLNLLLGHEVSNSGGTNMRIKATHFPANFTKDNAFAMINQYDATKGTMQVSSGISTPSRTLSYFGRMNYGLLDKYLLTLTFRADGSSIFSPNNRWGYFPAAALGWRISEEEFLNEVDWLDNLKLRLSYGTVGNDGISSDLWSQLWASETNYKNMYTMNGQYLPGYTYSSSQMANKDLKWETTITRNLGFDFGFFNNRIWGTLDLYWNTTKDLLMLTSIPGVTGFTSTYDNIGQTSNKGLELSLSGVLFRNKDWNITAGFNINFNKNNVDKLSDDVSGLYGTKWAGSTHPENDYILKEGSPIGIVRGYVYDGFYTTDDFNYIDGQYVLKDGIPDLGTFIAPVHGTVAKPSDQNAYPGLPKFRNLDDDNTVIDDGDVTEIGRMVPKHTGGFNLNVTYKNFDLGAYFNWSYGNDVYNANKLASMYSYKETGTYMNKLSFMKDSYKIYDVVDGQLVSLQTPEQLDAANTNAKYPLPYSENGVVSSIGIEDGSFLRLNTLTLGYSMPQKLLQKICINKMRLYCSIYNVFTLTGYSGLDPEVNTDPSKNSSYPTLGLDWGAYPRARSFVVGLNVQF